MAIFYKTRVLGIRFWILLLLSVAIMAGDYRQIVVPKVKALLQVVIDPLQYVVTVPGRVYISARDYLTLQHELVHAKQHWQDQKLQLEVQVQQLNALKIQNQELQALLKTTPVQQNQKYILARVEKINMGGLSRQIIIDRGSNDGIEPGQAVISDQGIVGQVIQSNSLNSRVMLLTDSKAAIPALNQRTQENLIVTGTGKDTLTVLDVSSTMDLKIGDVLLSSGMGGHYPSGSPVGTVVNVVHGNSNLSKVFVKPAANMNQFQAVLVVSVPKKDKAS